nr:hypothetical protein [Brevibacillus migulae]
MRTRLQRSAAGAEPMLLSREPFRLEISNAPTGCIIIAEADGHKVIRWIVRSFKRLDLDRDFKQIG